MLMRLAWLGVGTVREQRVELQTLIARRLTAEFSKVPKLGADIGHAVVSERGDKFVLTERGKRGGAAHRDHGGAAKTGNGRIFWGLNWGGHVPEG